MIEKVSLGIGIISLIIGVISLIFSYIGYKQAKTAAKEAKEAKEKSDTIKKLIKKVNYTKEIRLDLKDNYERIRNKVNRKEKAAGLLSMLTRIHSIDEAWRTNDVQNSLEKLNRAIEQLEHEYDMDKPYNTKAMSMAEGIIVAYIDILGERIMNVLNIDE